MSEFSVASVISDHGIFQWGEEFPLFGRGEAGKKVEAELWMEETCIRAQCVIEENGRWRMTLPPSRAGGPYRLKISCQEEVYEYFDLYAGDVWVLAGQSNMQLPMERVKYRFPQEYQQGTERVIRQFTVPIGWNFEIEENEFHGGKWICPTGTELTQFSAVGYFFGKKLAETEGIPVGLILTAVGGTPIEAWMSRESFEAGKSPVSLPAHEDAESVMRLDEQRIEDWHRRAGQTESRQTGAGQTGSVQTGSVQTGAGQTGAVQRGEGLELCETPILSDWEQESLDLRDWNRQKDIFSRPGVYWLRKLLSIPEDRVGEPVRLSLGTITDADETFVNGALAGNITYQYPPREYELSGFSLTDNEIMIRMTVHDKGGGFTWGKEHKAVWSDGWSIDLSRDWQWCMQTEMEPLKPQTFFERYPIGMYQHMIAPLHQIPIKGVCWYQGEMNAEDEVSYSVNFEKMVTDWRRRWGKDDLAFLFVQLPNYDLSDAGNWIKFRNMQQKLLRIPNTAMVVTLDCGEDNDLHPTDKKTVGERLCMAAGKMVYGRAGDLFCPVFSFAEKTEGELVRESDRELDKELDRESDKELDGELDKEPDETWVLHICNAEEGLITRDGKEPGGLEFWSTEPEEKVIAPDKATIQGNKLLVSVPKHLQHSGAVLRYAWSNRPVYANLCNKNMLPLSPFEVMV